MIYISEPKSPKAMIIRHGTIIRLLLVKLFPRKHVSTMTSYLTWCSFYISFRWKHKSNTCKERWKWTRYRRKYVSSTKYTPVHGNVSRNTLYTVQGDQRAHPIVVSLWCFRRDIRNNYAYAGHIVHKYIPYKRHFSTSDNWHSPFQKKYWRFVKCAQKYRWVPRNVWSGVSGTGNANMKLVLV